MLSSKRWNDKASNIKLVYLYWTIKMMHGPINLRKKLSACLYHFYWYTGYDANFRVIFSVICSDTSLVVHVSDTVEVSIYLRCGTTSLGQIWDIFTPEDEIIKMSQNIWHELSSDAASHPRRTETSTAMVHKSRTSHSYCNCYVTILPFPYLPTAATM